MIYCCFIILSIVMLACVVPICQFVLYRKENRTVVYKFSDSLLNAEYGIDCDVLISRNYSGGIYRSFSELRDEELLKEL